jgi:hypothetical protein
VRGEVVVRRQVFDCFTFFNELDLLEVRLEELNSAVDWFVLVEAGRTFSNKPKPFVFKENARRFAKFLHKIIPISLALLPERGSTWSLEAFQRDAILLGLTQCGPDDYVLISDLDEIPRARTVHELATSGWDAGVLSMPTYYYKFNCKNMAGEVSQPLTVFTKRRLLTTPQEARGTRFGLPWIPNAGWHFSYLGNETKIREKIDAFSHQELNTPEFTDPRKLTARVHGARDLFERPGYRWEFVPLDETFPRFVRENQERFAHLIEPVAPAALRAS